MLQKLGITEIEEFGSKIEFQKIAKYCISFAFQIMFTSEENHTYYVNTSMGLFNETFEFDENEKSVLECPVYSDEGLNMIGQMTFWVDGWINCVLAFVGLIANIISAMILGK